MLKPRAHNTARSHGHIAPFRCTPKLTVGDTLCGGPQPPHPAAFDRLRQQYYARQTTCKPCPLCNNVRRLYWLTIRHFVRPKASTPNILNTTHFACGSPGRNAWAGVREGGSPPAQVNPAWVSISKTFGEPNYLRKRATSIGAAQSHRGTGLKPRAHNAARSNGHRAIPHSTSNPTVGVAPCRGPQFPHPLPSTGSGNNTAPTKLPAKDTHLQPQERYNPAGRPRGTAPTLD